MRKPTNPYWYPLLGLLFLAAFTVFFNQVFFTQLLVSLLTVLLIDVAFQILKNKEIYIRPEPIVSGLLVALTFGQTHFSLFVFASACAIVGAHLFEKKVSSLHFTALSILVTSLLFSVPLTLWAARELAVVFLVGSVVTYLLRKDRIAISFLLFSTALVLLRDVIREAFSFSTVIPAFLSTSFFFAFFFLSDPKTTPEHAHKQLIFGGLVSVLAFIGHLFLIPQHLFVGLLVTNLFFFFWQEKNIK